MELAKSLEKPLPRPRRDSLGYASARVLEALLESLLALEFLKKGYTRNAAGKTFQAWRALTGAILAIEAEEIAKNLGEEQRKWLQEVAIPRVPSTKLKTLSHLIEERGYENYGPYTDRALDLHDYQYHGPDPAAELSKYPTREEAVRDIIYMIQKIIETVEKIKPRLESEKAWTQLHQDTLEKLRQRLGSS